MRENGNKVVGNALELVLVPSPHTLTGKTDNDLL